MDNTRKTQSKTGNRLLQRTPEQTRKRMSDRVRNGVAVVSGAVEGFATELRDSDLPGNAEQAVTLAGQTARRFAETGAYEVAKTRRRVQSAAQGVASRRSKSSGSGMSSRGGRSGRSRASALGKAKRSLSRKLPAIKRKVASKKASIKRKIGPKKAALKRKASNAKRTIARKMPMKHKSS
ncbi:MAG TPA: hypothetical protein VM241_03750 [Candidatus Thermoplasmatota archaeon]|nr:hypothetical protein [Candidatus Thermoplasmatota archaeon]